MDNTTENNNKIENKAAIINISINLPSAY